MPAKMAAQSNTKAAQAEAPGSIPDRGLAAEPGLAGQEHRSNENDCQRDGYPAGHQLDLDRRVGAAVGVASAPPEGGVLPAASGVGDGVDAAGPPGAAVAAAGGGPGSSFLPVSPVQLPYAAQTIANAATERAEAVKVSQRWCSRAKGFERRFGMGRW